MRARRIAVDLTPVLPGGANGGAKVLAKSLVQHLGALAPETHFTLYTSSASHVELADLDAPNVRRQCVDAAPGDADLNEAAPRDAAPLENVRGRVLGGARGAARVAIDTLLPAALRQRAKDRVWTVVKRQQRAQAARTTAADLLFCPFTAPFFAEAGTPTVALVHDLQFIAYPEFFPPEQRLGRAQHFRDACARADRVICVSDFVRQTVLANSDLPADRVQTIRSTVLHATQPVANARAIAASVLGTAGITATDFLLYPANPWPHKNHRALIDGFAAYLQSEPWRDLALVCTGAPSHAVDDLRAHAHKTLPDGRFAFVGFVAELEFAALLRSCRALIFPSLYEGFGLPILEAMACGRPVLCSNTSSLPEIAGDAALLFDPRAPREIAAAIARLEAEPEAEADTRVERGHARVTAFGTPRDLAGRYLAAFDEVLELRRG